MSFMKQALCRASSSEGQTRLMESNIKSGFQSSVRP